MTIRETEYTKGSPYYGHGIVFCQPKTDSQPGCHKDGTHIHQEWHGYERDTLTDEEVVTLNAAAQSHQEKYPTHDIRVIVFQRPE